MQRVMACVLSDLAVGYFSQDRNKAYRAYDQPLMDAYAALHHAGTACPARYLDGMLIHYNL